MKTMWILKTSLNQISNQNKIGKFKDFVMIFPMFLSKFRSFTEFQVEDGTLAIFMVVNLGVCIQDREIYATFSK